MLMSARDHVAQNIEAGRTWGKAMGWQYWIAGNMEKVMDRLPVPVVPE